VCCRICRAHAARELKQDCSATAPSLIGSGCLPSPAQLPTYTGAVYGRCSDMWKLYGFPTAPANGPALLNGPAGKVQCIGGYTNQVYDVPALAYNTANNGASNLNGDGPGLACFNNKGQFCSPSSGGVGMNACPCQYISPANSSNGWVNDVCLICPSLTWAYSQLQPQGTSGLSYPYSTSNPATGWPGVFSNPGNGQQQFGTIGGLSPPVPNPASYINPYVTVKVYCQARVPPCAPSDLALVHD